VPVPAPVPDIPPLPPLLPVLPLSMPLPVLPLLPLLPLLPASPPPMCMELHAVSPNASASKPASSTLWCLCFMINSF
jgi:hypothetical protein